MSLGAVVAMHAELVDRFGGSHGLLNAGAVEAALARPRHRHDYDAAADVPDLAAAYLVGLVRAHGFVDGNKRIGADATLVFLIRNGRPLHVPQEELFRIVMGVAEGRTSESEVAAWIRDCL